MNLSSLLKVLWSHWRVVVPVALLSLLACVGLVVVSGPTYRASAAVVLLNPPALPEVTPENPTVPPQYQNPYARFGDLSVIVDILVHVLGSEPTNQQLKAAGLTGTFEIAANRDFYRGPIIDISAEASSGKEALKNAQLVIDELDRQLIELQKAQGTDPSYYIKPNVIVPPNKATTVLSGTLRKLILLGGVGGLLTIGSGLIADARSRRRRKVHSAVVLEDIASTNGHETSRVPMRDKPAVADVLPVDAASADAVPDVPRAAARGRRR